jgi:DNA-binding CsgD family transcriptional regulator
MPGQPQETTLVGRETVLGDVADFVDALAVAPAALLLEGEPGIGKTTLWRSARSAVADRGHRVLAVTAVEGETDLPFVGLRDLLDEVAPDAAPDLPPPQRDALDAALLRSADPRAVADQHAVCVAVLGVVRALAADEPLVIAVDDVGWLDRSSDRVLRYVVRRLTTERVGILATRRPTGSAPPLGLDGPPLDARLHHVMLGPLDRDAIHALLTGRYGLALPRRLTRRIHAACGGNPFSAVEIGRTLSARGDRILDEDALPLPSGVLRVTATRIAALRPPAQQVLAVVAVSGAATLPLLASVLGDDADVGLDEAETEGLLQLDGSAVRFVHPLLRSAVAAGLTVAERRRMHRRLAGLVTDPDARAVHLGAAAAGPDEAVATALEQSARRAFARGAPDTAAGLMARAASLTPPDEGGLLARRRIQISEYRYHAEDMDGAHAELNALVAELPSGERRAEALLWLACVRKAQNGAAEATELARASLAEAQGDGLRAAAERLLAQALVIVGAVRSAHRHAAAALVRARTTGDPGSIAEGEATLAWTQFFRGGGVRPDLLTVVSAHRAWSVYAPQEATPAIVTGIILSFADHVRDARNVLQAEDRRLVDLGQDRPRALLLFALAELECRAGDLASAQWCAEEGLCVTGLVGDDVNRAFLLCAHGRVAAQQGRLDDARAAGQEAAALATLSGSAGALGLAHALLAFCALSAGDPGDAHRHLEPICARLTPEGDFDPGYARFVPDEVEALVALGRTDEADRLLAPFAQQAAALDRPCALAVAGRCRALLQAAAGDLDAAADTVAAALGAHDRVPLPFERARTLLVAGSVQRRLRRRREARAALDDALAEFTRLGATVWADKAQAERRRIGGRVGSPQELTDAERRVAERVAAGLSNKEVAATLFLSVSTVEAALWKIYRKLDVRSRTQLAARLAERERAGTAASVSTPAASRPDPPQ